MGKYASYFAPPDYANLLKDRVAVLTGAASPIGQATARLFAQHGAILALTDKEPAGESLAAQLRDEFSAEVRFYPADLSSEAATDALAKEILADFGKVDILVHGAAVWEDAPVTETGLDTASALMRVNFLAAAQLTQAFLPCMKEMRRGAIVSITSNYVQNSRPGVGFFGASKAALQSFTLCLAQEYAKFNIRPNCIMPGFSIGNHGERYIAEHGEKEARWRFDRMQPIHRQGTPEDVANAVLFLASDLAQNVIGECLPVQGGADIEGHIQLTCTRNRLSVDTAPRRFV